MKVLTQGRRGLAMVLAVVMLATVLLASWPTLLTEAADTSALRGKSAIFFGDSIAAGWRDQIDSEGITNYSNSGGWSYRLQRDFGMVSTLKAVAGSSFTTIADRNHIPTLIQNAGSGSYDYVILEGGFNDAMGSNTKPSPENTAARVGTITNSFFPEDFDSTTFAGELEHSLYLIKKQYPNAKVGYIITYQTPNSEYGGVTAKAFNMRQYWTIAKQICEKWDVQVLDLYDGVAADGKHYSNDVLDMDNASTASVPGSGDHIHLSKTGYDLITPYIAQWMVGLNVPSVTTWSCGYESPYAWNDDLTAPGTPNTSKNYAKVSTSQHFNGGQSLKMQSGGYPNAENRAQTLLRDNNKNLIQLTDRTKDYRISFWVHMSSSTSGGLRYYIALDNNDSSFTTADKDAYKLVEGDKTIEKNTWVRVTHVLTGVKLQNMPDGYNYIRLGLTSTEDQTIHEFWIDDVQVSQYSMDTVKADYEQYSAGNNMVAGNGSGREVSSTHAHGGNGVDAPGQKSVRLKMNQPFDANYARTVVQTAEGNNLQVVAGLKYTVSFWAYWAADEGNSGFADTLPVTYGGGTVAVGYANSNGIKEIAAQGNKTDVTMKANTWQKVSVIVSPSMPANSSTAYLTIGAKFPGAAVDKIGYLYIDDIEVNLLSNWSISNDVVEAPNGALLYNDGTNATYYNVEKNEEMTALRVMGKYKAEQGAADVVYANGMPLQIISRGILLGNNQQSTNASLRVDGTYVAKTETYGDKLSSYWEYEEETGKIVYTLLLKNINQNKANNYYYAYRTFMTVDVSGEQMTVYSPLVYGLNARSVYNGTNQSLKWFGNATGSGSDSGVTATSVSLLNGLDSRYSIVYDADDSQAKAAAEELQEQMVRLFGDTKVVTCASDTAASTKMTYEILIGNTNRSEDDAVISAVAGAHSQHDAAFAVKYNNKKVAIAAKNTGDATKYGIVLQYAVEYFLDQVSKPMAVSTSLDFNSASRSMANGTGGNPGRVFTVNNGGTDLMNSAWIVVEKYPSYMVMEAARDLQKYLATETGEYVPIMKNEDHTTNATSIYVGPQQGAVRVHYAETDWGITGPAEPNRPGNTGSDDGAFDLSPTNKKGYVDTNQTDSALLETDDIGDYEIKIAGSWPAKVWVNGGSVYAVNAGVQKLIDTLKQGGDLVGTQTGNYTADGKYSLSGGYGMAYEENFDMTSAAEVQSKYTIDKDYAPGPTEVDPAVVGEGNYMESGGRYWDVQSRPATWGTSGTYYTEGGYLYEYSRKTNNGYTAVRVTTQNKMTYRYGFTEARMVTATDNGACSAIWAVSETKPGSEIDLYENFGRDSLVVNMHYWKNDTSFSLDSVAKYNTIKSYDSSRLESGEHFYDTFHYIGFEWDAYEFTYYIDGEAWLTVDITEPMLDKNGNVVIPEYGLEAFRQPIWIKITNGVGVPGYTGGADPVDYAEGGSKHKDPARGKYDLKTVDDYCETQVVDYFYIFQKKDNGSQMNIKY